MKYAKKWMVVPYESDEEIEPIRENISDILKDKNITDYDRAKKYENQLVKNQHKIFQNNVDENVIVPIKIEIDDKLVYDKKQEKEKEKLVEEKTKTGINDKFVNSFKFILNPDKVKTKMSESFVKRIPSEGTRAKERKRKLDRSNLFNDSRFNLNNSRLKNPKSNENKRKKMGLKDPSLERYRSKNIKKLTESKKVKKMLKNLADVSNLRYARLEDDDIDYENDDEVENNETLYKDENMDFGNISKIPK